MISIDDLRLNSIQCTKLLPVEICHENPWFSVKKRGTYYTVESFSTQTIILSTLEDSSIIMVRQKRPVIDDITLELPAGAVNKGESPVIGARREFFEETGIFIDDITRFKPLLPIANSPNRNPYLLYIFNVNVKQDEFEARTVHDDEISAVEVYKYREIIDKIISGEIYITVPIAIIGRYLFGRIA